MNGDDRVTLAHDEYCEMFGNIGMYEWNNLTEIQYSGISLETLDLGSLPPDLHTLELKHGNIGQVICSRPMKRLSRVTIRGCHIAKINIGDNLPELSMLHLPNNDLKEITVPNGKLYNLDLSSNKLTRIKMNHQRRQMMTFDVSHNPELASLPEINTFVSVLGVKGCPNLYGENVDMVKDAIL